MARQAKTYRLPDQTVDLIAETAQRDGCSATQVIVRAIAAYCGNADKGSTESSTDDALVEALRDQVADLQHRNDRLDQHIEHLQLLLSQSQQQVVLFGQQLALPGAGKGKKKAKKGKKGKK